MNGLNLKNRLRYSFRENTFNFVIRTLIILVYVAGIIYTTAKSARFAELAETPLISPTAYTFLTHIRPLFLILGGGGVLFSLFYPFDRKSN